MNFSRIRLFLFLIFSPIFSCLLYIFPHHAIAQVYYCGDNDATGFNFDKKANEYIRTRHKSEKFKIQVDLSNKSITMKQDGSSRLYNCIDAFAANKILSCQSNTHLFNFNPNNGRYVSAAGFGYVYHDGDSISISYGTCDEF